MYGVPEDLDLSMFQGANLELIGLGPYTIHFNFGNGAAISVGGTWQLHDPRGEVSDQSCPPEERQGYYLHPILNQCVKQTMVDAPDAFSLTFDNGYCLTVIDDSKQYETCEISPAGVLI